MLTFRELKELLDEAPEMDRVPSMRELMRTGTVFMERPVVNGVVTVFTNGLALFEEFDRHTVFPVHSCGAYVYGGSITAVIPEADFDDADWPVRLVLEGEDRIEHSRENCDSDRRNISHSGMEDSKMMADHKDPLEAILQEERRQQAHECLKLTTEKQQQAIRAYYEADENMAKAAELLGIKRQTCDQHVRSGIERIRRKCRKEDF